MTIAISLKVNDGVVLAADSASTLFAQNPNQPDALPLVATVYNNANKVFNLRKGLPIGAITWGSGNIGLASIGTLAKDLRLRFSGQDPDHADWTINRDSYTITEVASRVREFMFEELYQEAFADWENKPPLGFVVAGYSSGAPIPEEFGINIQEGECGPPALLREENTVGVTWNGEPEALTRLILGAGTGLPQVLHDRLGVPEDQLGPVMDIIAAELTESLIQAPMPLQDAIDVADFLVDLTIKYSRFTPGAPTVGGPIEIAAISKHEGFRWIKRKYYYSRDLNPEEAS